MSSTTGPAVTGLGVAHSGKRGHDMKSKRLLAAATAAITMMAGGLGMALWPWSAGAVGSIRKFSGFLFPGGDTGMTVLIHNPDPTATFKPTVVVREFGDRRIPGMEEARITPVLRSRTAS